MFLQPHGIPLCLKPRASSMFLKPKTQTQRIARCGPPCPQAQAPPAVQQKVKVIMIFILLILQLVSLIIAKPICPPLPPHIPKDITDVAPNNIKVMMALGDSITAGFGANGLSGGLFEYRKWSALIGSNEDNSTTLFEIINAFSPDVIGGSTGHHLAEKPGWSYYQSDVLNGAQSGAKIHDLSYQLDHLINVATSDPNIDMNKDYKLFSILIGANDLCRSCGFDPDHFIGQLERQFEGVIEKIYKNFPRTIVNIVPLFNISRVYELDESTTYCKTLHYELKECPCLYAEQKQRDEMDVATVVYFEAVQRITNKWQAKKLKDFAVVYQPFTRGLNIPNINYLSGLDCFHPSQYAHQQIAIATWNSLITPVGKKPTTFKDGNIIDCPDSNSRIFV